MRLAFHYLGGQAAAELPRNPTGILFYMPSLPSDDLFISNKISTAMVNILVKYNITSSQYNTGKLGEDILGNQERLMMLLFGLKWQAQVENIIP